MGAKSAAALANKQALENAALMQYNYKLPADYWQTYPARVNALTAEQLNEASKLVVHPENMIWLIIGDLNKVQAGVKELNYGEVIYIDADGNPVNKK